MYVRCHFPLGGQSLLGTCCLHWVECIKLILLYINNTACLGGPYIQNLRIQVTHLATTGRRGENFLNLEVEEGGLSLTQIQATGTGKREQGIWPLGGPSGGAESREFIEWVRNQQKTCFRLRSLQVRGDGGICRCRSQTPPRSLLLSQYFGKWRLGPGDSHPLLSCVDLPLPPWCLHISDS